MSIRSSTGFSMSLQEGMTAEGAREQGGEQEPFKLEAY